MDLGWNVRGVAEVSWLCLKKLKSSRTTFFSVLFATLNSLRLQSETKIFFLLFQVTYYYS